MREIVKGHWYALQNLKDAGETEFQFYMDPDIHGGQHLTGPSTQEVIRMVIARVKSLEEEQHDEINQEVIDMARFQIAMFEMRAVKKKAQKGLLTAEQAMNYLKLVEHSIPIIESLDIDEDGHIIWGAERNDPLPS